MQLPGYDHPMWLRILRPRAMSREDWHPSRAVTLMPLPGHTAFPRPGSGTGSDESHRILPDLRPLTSSVDRSLVEKDEPDFV